MTNFFLLWHYTERIGFRIETIAVETAIAEKETKLCLNH